MNLYLIGHMGAGKSTVGRLLSAKMGLPFLDVDQVIEAEIGQSLADYIASQGEVAFRQLEAQVVLNLSQHAGYVIATGGGVVLCPENRALLASTGKVIYLQVSIASQLQRLATCQARPAIQVTNKAARLQQIQAARDGLYDSIAHQMVVTDHLSAQSVANQLYATLVPNNTR